MPMSIGNIDSKPNPPLLPPRDRKISLRSGDPPSTLPIGVQYWVDSGIDVGGMRALALSRPDFKFGLLGSRSSPRWNAFTEA